MNKLRTSLIIAATIAASSAFSQEIVKSEEVTVVSANCLKSEDTSVVGTGVGGVAGGVAGRMLGGMFGKTGKSIGTWAGAAAGAYVGNEMGKNTTYQCEIFVKSQSSGKKSLVNYIGIVEPKTGMVYNMHTLSNGQIKIASN